MRSKRRYVLGGNVSACLQLFESVFHSNVQLPSRYRGVESKEWPTCLVVQLGLVNKSKAFRAMTVDETRPDDLICLRKLAISMGTGPTSQVPASLFWLYWAWLKDGVSTNIASSSLIYTFYLIFFSIFNLLI